MKFSVLLPTHNRLDLLKYAVESVLSQNYDNWELIVSDNVSEDDVEGYLASLNEARIKYYKTGSFLSVTKNWNASIEKADGDYVIMLGDDDALMPNYFGTMSSLVKDFNFPELVYTDAYNYAYPGVMPGFANAYLRPSMCPNPTNYFDSRDPHILSKDQQLDIVKRALSFDLSLSYNMQLSLMSQKLINKLKESGHVYQSLFPDFYTSIAGFLVSDHTLVYQKPVAIVGISRKSHGYYFVNAKAGEARSLFYDAFLDDELSPISDVVLPGDWLLVGWLSAADTVARNFHSRLEELHLSVDRKKYRIKTIQAAYDSYYLHGVLPVEEFQAIRSKMNFEERLQFASYDVSFNIMKLLHLTRYQWRARSFWEMLKYLLAPPPPTHVERWEIPGFDTIHDVIERMPAPLYIRSDAR